MPTPPLTRKAAPEAWDTAGAARRMTKALGLRIADGRPDELSLLLQLQADTDAALTVAVLGLREHGHSDTEIGEALGITRQAVSKRWPGGGRFKGSAGRYRKHPTQPGDK